MGSTLWDRCLTQLETELSDQQLNTWIRPLQAHESGPHLRIMAPNRFVRDMVQANFYARIREIVTTISSPELVQVDLVIGTGEAYDATIPETIAPIPEARAEAVRPGLNPALRSSQTPGNVSFQKRGKENNLNPGFTFDNLVEGKSNQLGRAAAMQIGTNPGHDYNPFMIYGGSGLGKTHLMYAIGNAIMANRPAARVLYLNSERYVADMVQALQHSRMAQFKDYYRTLDALLIDDIQFFAGKEQTQEEFFHNFNALFEGGHQIVMTCDQYPKAVNGLAERLKSRFGWGLTAAVEPPELEMRVAILNAKAERAGHSLPSEVSFFIAKRIRSNVRELEGALRRVIANSQLMGTPITLDFAREALSDMLAVQSKLVTVENIQKTVAEYYKIRLADLSSKDRSRSVARPRQVAMSLAKELTSKSYPEIGIAFGGRDHTTVMHAMRKVAELRESDPAVREDHAILLRILTA